MNRLRLTIIYGIAAATLVSGITFGVRALTGNFGTPPRVIPYRGYLEQDSVPVTGTRRLTLRLHTAATGGSVLWTEVHPEVAVQSGNFQVNLGSITALSPALFRDRDSLFISVQVESQQLNGRQRLLTAPHAMVADQAIGANNFHVAGNLSVGGQLTVTGRTTNLSGSILYSHQTGMTSLSTDMGAFDRRVCFLRKYVPLSGGRFRCDVSVINDRWHVSAQAVDTGASGRCDASCLTW